MPDVLKLITDGDYHEGYHSEVDLKVSEAPLRPSEAMEDQNDDNDDWSSIAQKGSQDLWFDPWLFARGEALKEFAEKFVSMLDARAFSKRKRARKPVDQANFVQSVEAVVVNLAYLVILHPSKDRLILSRNTGTKRTRYDNQTLPPKRLNTVVDSLRGLALDVRTGRMGRGASTVAPNKWFKRKLVEAGVTRFDFGHREDREVIALSRTEKSFRQDARGDWGVHKARKLLEYEDTEVTTAYRAEIRRLNAFMGEADIRFLEDGQEPPVDSHDRVVSRQFKHVAGLDECPTFDRNGRLSGGFWMNLKKERRAGIRISGEPAVVLDYANSVPRLAYAHISQTPPAGDLYDLTGLLQGYDHQVHRDGVKSALNSLLNGGKAAKPEILQKLPGGTKASAIRQALALKHPHLPPLFGTPVGLRLMFLESQILLKVLDVLMEEGIVALPLHDGLLVRQSALEVTRGVMEGTAKSLAEAEMPVSVSLTG